MIVCERATFSLEICYCDELVSHQNQIRMIFLLLCLLPLALVFLCLSSAERVGKKAALSAVVVVVILIRFFFFSFSLF